MKANHVADLLGNDGQRFENTNGETLATLALANGGKLEIERDCHDLPATGGMVRWQFDDGSAIVIAQGAWDVRANGCQEFCWEGTGCECDDVLYCDCGARFEGDTSQWEGDKCGTCSL